MRCRKPCPRRRRNQRGFSLLEMGLSISLMSLLFLGAMTLMLTANRTAARTQAQVFATADAANAIQSVVGRLQTAQNFALPASRVDGEAETGWVMPSGLSTGQFTTTLNGAAVNTALEIIAPPILTPDSNGYAPGSADTIRVQSLSGGFLPIHPTQNTGVGTQVTLIYRGGPDGMPDAAAGAWLWQYTIPVSRAFTPDLAGGNPKMLCKSVGDEPNAVQFVRPVLNGIPQPWQVEIKIISSYYSPINNRQTNEQGDGSSSSSLSGKCVYMRDHSPTAGAPADANVRPSNNVFQYR